MTQEELDMMEQIHFYGKIFSLNEENSALLRKMIEELQKGQEEVAERENQT